MTRSSLALLFLGLAACSGNGSDASAYLDRSPALKTTDTGFEYQVAPPAGARDLSNPRVHGSWASVDLESNGCPAIAVYHFPDAELDIRAPRHVVDGCQLGLERPNDLSVADLREGRLLTRSGLLFDFDADGIQLLADLSVVAPIEDFYGAAIVDQGLVAVRSGSTVHLLGSVGSSWENVARLQVDGGYRPLQAAGDLLGAGEFLFRRTGADWERIEDSDYLQPDSLTADSFRGSLEWWDWNGVSFEPRDVRCGHFLMADGSTYGVWGRSGTVTLGVHDRMCESSERSVLQNVRALALDVGQVFVVNQSNGLTWVRLQQQDPIEGVVLEEALTVARGEQHQLRLEVPEEANELVITLEGTEDADLYVRRDAAPELRQFDCAPYRYGSAETCTFPAPTPGTWYVGVFGFAPSSEVVVRATVD